MATDTETSELHGRGLSIDAQPFGLLFLDEHGDVVRQNIFAADFERQAAGTFARLLAAARGHAASIGATTTTLSFCVPAQALDAGATERVFVRMVALPGHERAGVRFSARPCSGVDGAIALSALRDRIAERLAPFWMHDLRSPAHTLTIGVDLLRKRGQRQPHSNAEQLLGDLPDNLGQELQRLQRAINVLGNFWAHGAATIDAAVLASEVAAMAKRWLALTDAGGMTATAPFAHGVVLDDQPTRCLLLACVLILLDQMGPGGVLSLGGEHTAGGVRFETRMRYVQAAQAPDRTPERVLCGGVESAPTLFDLAADLISARDGVAIRSDNPESHLASISATFRAVQRTPQGAP